MSVDPIAEILAAHADQLNSGEPVRKDVLLAALPGRHEEIESLLDVAARAKRALKPVHPSPSFRRRLHNGLLMAAHYRQGHQIFIEKRGEPQWGWLLGAAALGSAAGLIAVVWRSRAQEQRAPRPALPPSAV
jgi:hypothetical protein